MFRTRIAFFAAALAALAVPAAVPEPFMTLETSATNVYVSETFTATVCVYLPPLPAPNDAYPPFLNRQPPHLQADFLSPGWKTANAVSADVLPLMQAFVAQDNSRPVWTVNVYQRQDAFAPMSDPFSAFDDPSSLLGPKFVLFTLPASRVAIGGFSYWRFAVTSAALKATAPGRIDLGAVSATLSLIGSVDKQSRVRLEGKTLNAPPSPVIAAEPPEDNRPASFTGAVGKGMTATAALDTNVCKVGDPLILTVEVGGGIDPAGAHPVPLAAMTAGGAFRVDDASARTETLGATRRFTYRVRAVKAGTVEFPPLDLSYFDTVRRAYVTVRTAAIPVQAKAAAQAVIAGVETGPADAGTFPMPDGLDLDARGASAEPLVPSLPFIALLLVCPPVLFLLVRTSPPAVRAFRARRAARRRGTALARCLRSLRSADPDGGVRAVRDYLTVRFGVNGAAATSADAERLMRADGVAAADVAAVAGCLAAAEDKDFTRPRGGGIPAVKVLVLGLALAVASGAVADDASARAFAWERASSLASRAAGEADFKAAAAAYGRLVADGAANPVLFTDLGACLVLAGEPAAALGAFARAERYGGATPATEHGVRAASARLRDDPRAEPPMTRTFLRLHVAFSVGARARAAAAAWAALWLLALLPRGAFRTFLLSLAACALIACAVSVSVSLAEERAAAAAGMAEEAWS